VIGGGFYDRHIVSLKHVPNSRLDILTYVCDVCAHLFSYCSYQSKYGVLLVNCYVPS